MSRYADPASASPGRMTTSFAMSCRGRCARSVPKAGSATQVESGQEDRRARPAIARQNLVDDLVAVLIQSHLQPRLALYFVQAIFSFLNPVAVCLADFVG